MDLNTLSNPASGFHKPNLFNALSHLPPLHCQTASAHSSTSIVSRAVRAEQECSRLWRAAHNAVAIPQIYLTDEQFYAEYDHSVAGAGP